MSDAAPMGAVAAGAPAAWREQAAAAGRSLRPDALLLIYTFFLTYGPKLGPLDTLSVMAVVILAHAAFTGTLRLRSELGPPIALLYLVSTYALLVVFVRDSGELQYFVRGLRALVNLSAAYALCSLFRARYGPGMAIKVVQHLFIAVALHATVMVMEIASPAFRISVYEVIGFPDRQGFRVPGLTISYGITAVTQGFGVIAAPIVGSRLRGTRSLLLFTLCTALAWASLFLAGRTGFFMMSGLFLVVAVFTGRQLVRSPRVWLGLGLASATIGVGTAVAPPSVRAVVYYQTLRHLFELYYTRQETGTAQSRTLNQLGRMYFVPSDPLTLLFGEGITGRGAVRIRSDVGYVLSLYGIGIIGTALLVSFYLYVLGVSWRLRRYDRQIALLSALFCLAVLVLNLKEQSLLTRHGFTVTSLLLSVWYLRPDALRAGNGGARAAGA